MNLQLKEKKLVEIGLKQGKSTLVVQRVIQVNYNIGFVIPIIFKSQRKGNWVLIKKC